MNGRWTRWMLALTAGLLIVCSTNIYWGKDHWRTLLQVDARGYYAYLPSLLLDGDPNLGSFDRIERETYYRPELFYEYRSAHNGRTIDKYWGGTALMQTPFFLGAHAYAHLTGNVTDGWSKPYMLAVGLAAIAWVVLGLWCTAKLLATYAVRDGWIAFTLVAFAFGTNLFYYAVVAPGMSHAYSFGLCSAFLLLARRLALAPRGIHFVVLGALLGAIVLVRPVNGLVVLALPIFFEGTAQVQRAWDLLKRSPLIVAASVLVFVCIAGLQFLYYHAATGDWFVYSYGNEGFNWTDPHIADILWSYRKGLFVYLPILLISLVGLWPLWERSRTSVKLWAAFFLLLTYVLSCWWNWWYGGSFGSRVYVEFFALFALPFALALQRLPRPWRTAFITVAVVLVVVCQVQTYQMRYGSIHWENMDRERYWEEFLRVDRLAG